MSDLSCPTSAPPPEYKRLETQIHAALDAATKENGYPHEYERSAQDIALEIHDWSGLEDFDPDDAVDVSRAKLAVCTWRLFNPREETA